MEWFLLWRHLRILVPADEYYAGAITFVALCYGCHVPFLNRIVSGLWCASILFDFRLLQTVMLRRTGLIDSDQILCVDDIHCVWIHFEFDIAIGCDENLCLPLLCHNRWGIVADATLATNQFWTLTLGVLLDRAATSDALYGFIDFYVSLMLRLLMMLL